MAPSTEGKLGILVGLLARGGGGAVWVAPNHTEIGWMMIAAAVIGGVALGFYNFSDALTRIWNPGKNIGMIALTGMIVCGIGALGFLGVYFWPVAMPDITLKYLYSHDFSNFMTENTDFNTEIKVADKLVNFSFSARMIFDFEHRARWLYYYIPADQNTFGISVWLVAHTDDVIIPKMDSGVSVTNSGMLGSGILAGKDLTFSRRIYIYHELVLTDSQIADIQHEATEKKY